MRIILISAHAGERSALQELLREDGHDVMAVAHRRDGVALATSGHADAIIADVQLPALDGVALKRELTQGGSHSQVILLCSRPGRALEPGLVCLTKPIDLARLHRYIPPRPAAEDRVA